MIFRTSISRKIFILSLLNIGLYEFIHVPLILQTYQKSRSSDEKRRHHCEKDHSLTKIKLYVNSSATLTQSNKNIFSVYLDKISLNYNTCNYQFFALHSLDLQICKINFPKFAYKKLTPANLQGFLTTEWDNFQCFNYLTSENGLKLSIPRDTTYKNEISSAYDLLTKKTTLTFDLREYKNSPEQLPFSQTPNSPKHNNLSEDHIEHLFSEDTFYDIDLEFLVYPSKSFHSSFSTREEDLLDKLSLLKPNLNKQDVLIKPLTQIPVIGLTTYLKDLTTRFLYRDTNLNYTKRIEILKNNKSESMLNVYLDNKLIDLDINEYGRNVDEDIQNNEEDNNGKSNGKKIKIHLTVWIIIGSVMGTLLIVVPCAYLFIRRKEPLDDYTTD